jgi:hypothetical protein
LILCKGAASQPVEFYPKAGSGARP